MHQSCDLKAEDARFHSLQAVNAQIKGGVRNVRTLMAVAPFAAISSSSVHTLMLITRAVSSFIKLYLLLLFMRVLLSWFPAFNWEDQPWLALRQVCLVLCASSQVCRKKPLPAALQLGTCNHFADFTICAGD